MAEFIFPTSRSQTTEKKTLLSRFYPRKEDFIPDILLVLMCCFALFMGISTTYDLDWPCDPWDSARDIASSQTILDGGFGTDPMYLGQVAWYNPLVPVIAAGISKITTIPVYLVYTRAGAYLNILAPITFYVMVAYLFDRWTAAASTLGFLFVVAGETASWAAATYSPWLYPANFTQSLFYATITILIIATRTRKRIWYIALGIFCGITFLGHTAPASLLLCIISYRAIVELIRSWDDKNHSRASFQQNIANFLLVFTIALLISLPFIYPIFATYRFKILNSIPNRWTYELLNVSSINNFVNTNISLVTGVALVGIICLFLQKEKRFELGILLVWSLICICYIAYSYLQQMFAQKQIYIPMIVPSFHFLFYFKAFISVMFGYGLFSLCQLIFHKFYFLKNHMSFWRIKYIEPSEAMLVLILIFVFTVGISKYTSRDEFTEDRIFSQQTSRRVDERKASSWIREHTDKDAVFVSSSPYALGVFVVAPAARKSVTVHVAFSNPYVSWETRDQDNKLMLSYLLNSNLSQFSALAKKYSAHYVIVTGDDEKSFDRVNSLDMYRVFISGHTAIYKFD